MAPDGVVTCSVAPVMFVNKPFVPVTVIPVTVVNPAVPPVIVVNCAVVPVTVCPLIVPETLIPELKYPEPRVNVSPEKVRLPEKVWLTACKN